MKPTDVKSSTYINSSIKINDKDPEFKTTDIARILKYKNNFAKGYVPNWSEENFMIKKLKATVLWTYVISDLKGKEIVGTFYEKELPKKKKKSKRIQNQKSNKKKRQ